MVYFRLKATFTLLRFHFYSFLQMKKLAVHFDPFSNENCYENGKRSHCSGESKIVASVS